MRDPSNQPNDDTIRQLSEYVDGSLDPADAVELMQRVATDRTLQKELEALRAADALIKTHQDEMPEVDWDAFSGSVRSRVEKSVKREKRTSRNLVFRQWRPLAAAAALAMSITAFLIVDRKPNAPQPLLSTISVDVSIDRPRRNTRNSKSEGIVIASVSRDRPADFFGSDSDIVGPPHYKRSILVVTGLN